MKDMREAFGEGLIKLAGKYPDLFVLDADLKTSTRTDIFANAYPERFIQVGIAEQNMVGISAGLAIEGKIPLVCTFADFLSKRACDQVSISVAYPGLNVKMAGAYPGLFTGKSGATHQSIQDLANMRAMPHLRVIDPCDNTELHQLMESMMQYIGPVYFRVSRQSVETIVPEGYHFEWGKGVVLLHGTDMTIMGTGIASHWALTAGKQLAAHGINARVVHMPCLKPFDRELAIKAATETGAIVTVENHSIIGGLGSAVCEILSEEYPVPVKRIGVRDEFVESGEDEELIEKYGLSIENIIKSSIDIMTIKKGNRKPSNSI